MSDTQSPAQPSIYLGPFPPSICQLIVNQLKELPMKQVEGVVVSIVMSTNQQIADFQADLAEKAKAAAAPPPTDDANAKADVGKPAP